MAVKPKAVARCQKETVKTGYLQPDMILPYVVQPAGGDVDLVAWATNNRESIEATLFKHGAVLFRNFKALSLGRFEDFARATSGRLVEYSERSSPRTLLSGFIYTSTDHPPINLFYCTT